MNRHAEAQAVFLANLRHNKAALPPLSSDEKCVLGALLSGNSHPEMSQMSKIKPNEQAYFSENSHKLHRIALNARENLPVCDPSSQRGQLRTQKLVIIF